MDILDYLSLANGQLQVSIAKQDREETIRLLRVVAETLQEAADKLAAGAD